MKKIPPIITIVVILLIIKNNLSSIVRTLGDENTAENLKTKLLDEEGKNAFLIQQLSYVKTNRFVEEEAREKLLMTRPGEYIVIAPTSTPINKKDIEVDDKPNWRKWWELFF